MNTNRPVKVIWKTRAVEKHKYSRNVTQMKEIKDYAKIETSSV